jgi:hypothetical protein
MNSNIIDANTYNMATMQLEHGKETLRVVDEISEFLTTLNISPDNNNKLVSMMTEQLVIAEREQFLNGFETAIKILKNAEGRKMENTNNLKGTKNNIECIKELIGLNIEPLQNEDYSFLKAINTMLVEYVNAKYGE